MRRIWLVEAGEYEQRGPVCAAAAPEIAERAIHAKYPAPYRVTWEPIKDDSWEYEGERVTLFKVVGHFERVPGHSVEHTEVFEIGPIDYFEAAPA